MSHLAGLSRAIVRCALLLPPLAACTGGQRARGGVSPRAGTLRAEIDALVEAPEFRNAHWGILIVDPARGDTLYSRNAGKLFLPASNMKIVTGAVALAQLGPEFRFRTAIAARGAIAAGTLRGDLAIVGRGDPTISDHMLGDAMLPLRGIADSVAARGVARVTGSVVSAGNAFSDANLGEGWPWDDLPHSYSAGVDELLFNEGFTRVMVRGGGRGGDPVTAITGPARRSPPLRVTARTVDATRESVTAGGGVGTAPAKTEITLSIDSLRGDVIVSGTVLPGDTVTEEIAHRDPAAAFLAALDEALRERTIAVLGGRSDSTTRLDTLFIVASPPLREILPALEKPSQNQIAEVLLKTLGLERTGVGSADSGKRVVASQLAAWGVAAEGFALADGSGLSRYNYLSPETIVRVLAAIRADTAFSAFYDAFPIAGIDGTIETRMRGTPAEGNVRAKTGFIAKARSLSGYVTTADGRPLIFSILCNNFTTPLRDVERVQDVIAARLAGMTVGGRHVERR
jgi:D-alanyl-D-alanine carboxypeptidase/D-alanyl-D-alanine-endopeptidase (penicillin-binding protein 4)